MKKLLIAMAIAGVLCGCQTAKYVVTQGMNDDEFNYDFEQSPPRPTNSWIASTDDWVKRHMW